MGKNSFTSEDIVVYEGAITKFGIITILVDKDNPDIRKATTEEIARYYARPNA